MSIDSGHLCFAKVTILIIINAVEHKMFKSKFKRAIKAGAQTTPANDAFDGEMFSSKKFPQEKLLDY